MHYAPGTPLEPSETLHSLVGAAGASIHWPRVGLFLAALVAADIPGMVIEPVVRGFHLPAIIFGVYLLSDIVLTGAVLLACRWFANPILAALLASALYIVGMLPVRIWQLLNAPSEVRVQFAVSLVLFGLAGNFLVLLGLHFGLRWIRPLFLALALGDAAGGLLAEVLQMARVVATGSALFLTEELRAVAFTLGSSALFAGAYWVGMRLPVMRLEPGALAAAGLGPLAPGVPADRAELQRAADFRSVRKRLRTASIGSILFGVFAIGLGVYSLKESPLNAFLILLGFFLLGEGIWILTRPTPTGMVVDGVALCAVGLWNIVVTISNLSAGAGGLKFPVVLGLMQIGWGIGSFRRYGRFAHLAGGSASAEAIERVDKLVAGIAEASMKTSADVIEFTANQMPWKARLTPELGVFVGGAEEEVILAGKSEVSITPQEAVGAKPFKAMFQLGPHSYKGSLAPEAYQRYEAWRSAR